MRRDKIEAKMLCPGDVILRGDGVRLNVVDVQHTGCYPTRVLVRPAGDGAETWLSLFTGERVKVWRCQ